MPAIYDSDSGRATTQAPKKKRLKKTARKPAPQSVDHATPPKPKVRVTPDQADRNRPPGQQAADRAASDRNISRARAEIPEHMRGLQGAHVTKQPDGKFKVHIDDHKKFAEHQRARIMARARPGSVAQAPVLKVLEQTTRPLHAVAGGADAAVQGKNVLHAAGRGIQNKDKTTFSDVLGHAGVHNKLVKGAVGFGLDVAFDPTTYVTFGAGSVAAKAGAKAAAQAEKKALKAGLTKDQAARMADRARKQTERTADQAKGATVKVAGREVPGVRKATAKAVKPARAAGRKAVPGKIREAARAAAADLNPDIAPVGVAKETSRRAVQATRTARAKITGGAHEAQQHAVGIRGMVGEANYSRIIDAIENGTIRDLPDELRAAAVRVRSQFRYANRQRKQAGIRGGEIKDRPQVKVPDVVADTDATAKAVGKARRAEAAAARGAEAAQYVHDVHQGRAEVLSRNVSGSNAERAAERGRRKRRSRLAPRYAAGGHGVQQTATAFRDAEQALRNATANREAAEAAHEAEKAAAAAQRSANARALKINAKRAAAPKEYIPHRLTDEAINAEQKATSRGTGRKVIRPTSSMARTDNRPLSVLRDEMPGRYSEDLPALYAERKTEGATSVARADLNRRIADLGRTVRKGHDITLEPGEGVYHVTGSDIRKVADKKELARLADTGSHSGPMRGRYVILNDDVVKRAIEGSHPTMQGPGIVRGLDAVQGGFKRIALATPGFHVRNLVGDTQNAYLGQPGHRLPRNMTQAARVLKAEGRSDKALRTLAKPAGKAGTIKTGRYGRVTYDEVARQLKAHGAMRSGYTARELPELSKGRVLAHAPRSYKRALLNREDLPRITTAVEALKRGATWEQAAQRVADYHFDYAHLTQFERQIARRAAPFYTFTARNIPRQFKSLATHPGKFANYQKLIEEASKAAGMDDEARKHRELANQLRAAGVKLPHRWEAMMSEWEQRNAGIPLDWRGQKFTVSFGLPLAQALNEVPGAAGGDQAMEYFKTASSLVTPIVKDPVEYFANYSFFFRDQIERDETPLVSAPSYVGRLPDGVRKDLRVAKITDKRTGKKVWAWPGKVDYIVKTVPGLPQYAQQLATEGTNRRGKGTAGKALQLFGVRAEPFDPARTLVNLAYQQQDKIAKAKARLNQQGVNAKNPTAEYRKLQLQEKMLAGVAYQGRQAQGYKVLPVTGGPRRRHGGLAIPGTGTGRVTIPGTGRIKIP
jgi:hypothetical protein